MKISHKLISAALVILIVIGIIGYISVVTTQKALEKSIGKNSTILATEVLTHIDRRLYRRIETFQEYCRDLEVQKILLESNREFEKLDNIQAYIKEKDLQWTSAAKGEITDFIQELTDNKLSEELIEKTSFYDEKYGYKVFAEVFVTNRYGVNAAQTHKTTDYYQADEDWWQRAKKDGLYLTNVEYDESADVYSTDICIRIDDDAGNFLGVMKVVLNIEETIRIIEQASNTSQYETTSYELVNKEGKVIYDTEYHQVFEDAPNEVLSRFRKVEHHKDCFFILMEPGEEEELIAYAHSKTYKDFKGLGWILVVKLETTEIFAPVTRLRNLLLAVMLILILTIALIGSFISYSVSVPLGKLKSTIAEISKGKLDTRIMIESKDEFGYLANSFNKMIENLETTTTSVDSLNKEIAERKWAEDTLKQAKEKIEHIYRMVPSAIFTVDINKRIISWNNKAAELTGYTDEEVIGKECSAFAFGPCCSKCELYADDVQKPIMGKECTIKRKDGQERIISKNVDLLTNEEGKVVGGIESFEDITEKKRIENALEESQGKLNSMLESIADNITVMDKDLNIVWANRITRSMFGNDIIGRKCYEVYHGRNKACKPYPCHTLKAFQDNNVHQRDTQVTDNNGNTRYFHCRANVALRDENGNSTAVLEISRDVTDRKQAKEALRKAHDELEIRVQERTAELEKTNEQLQLEIAQHKQTEETLAQKENLLQNIISATREAMISIGDDGLITLFNPGAEEMFGYKKEEMLGQHLECLMPEQYRPPHPQYVKNYFATGKPDGAIGKTVELPALRSNGDEFLMEISLSAGSLGDKQFVIAVARDITERKQAETRQDELLEKVENMNEELKEFTSIISHDLKAPLRGIKTLANWILSDCSDKLDDQAKEHINLLLERVERMYNLIEGTLQYSRAGRAEETQAQVDLNDFVPEIINMVVPPENITVTIENKLPVIECEETHIMQLFQNLLSNAIKYMDKPQGWIKVGSVEQDGSWKFSVADNGPGIEEKHFEKIFKIFQALPTSPDFEGTGVGLTVVKKIVELYEGRIWVESKVGEGSTFFFTLPKQKMEAKK